MLILPRRTAHPGPASHPDLILITILLPVTGAYVPISFPSGLPSWSGLRDRELQR